MFKPIKEWEILTPNGWSEFLGIMNNGIKLTYSIYLENDETITATADHMFFINNFPISVKDLIPGNSIDSIDGNLIILDIKINKEEEVFDIIETSDHKFYVNSVISKNCDEFAFVPPHIADQFFASNMPTISTGGRCIIVSTPNGTGNLFYNLWKSASEGTGDFPMNPVRIDYRRVPGRDEKWAREQRMLLGGVRFAQEYECAFQGSSITLIDADFIINKLNKVQPLITPDDYTKMWSQVRPNHKYVITCDTGAGVGSDFSIINVFDVTDIHKGMAAEQVAIWRCNTIPPTPFTEYVYSAATYWNDAYVIIEVNPGGYGDDVCKELFENKGYENIFYDIENKRYGVLSSKGTKPRAAKWFKEDLEGGKIIIRDEQTIDELGYFEEASPGVFKAKIGRNLTDDCVMSCLWLSYFLHSTYFEGEKFDWENKELKDKNPEEWYKKNETSPSEIPLNEVRKTSEEEDAWEGFLAADAEAHDPENWLEYDELQQYIKRNNK